MLSLAKRTTNSETSISLPVAISVAIRNQHNGTGMANRNKSRSTTGHDVWRCFAPPTVTSK